MLKGIVKGNNLLNENIFSDADSTHINYMKSNPVTLSAGVAYTFSCNASCNGLYIRDVSNDDNIASGNNVSSVSYTPDNDIQVYFRIWNSGGVTGLQPMVNEGLTPLPYEPYQISHDITRIPMRSKNLFDAKTAYGNMYNDGIVSGTTLDISRIRNYFTSEQIGKQITISIYANKVTATRIYVRSNIADNVTDSNYISTGDMGVMSMTITPQSINDYWGVTYGSYSSSECIISNLMLNEGSTALPYVPYGMVEGWEVRDQQGRIIWGADKTLTGTDSITYKGYGLDIKEYDIEGNMNQSSTPSPTNPIIPEECGYLTEQIIDYTLSESGGIDASGNFVQALNLWRSTVFYEIHSSITLSFVAYSTLINVRVNYYDADYTHISREEFRTSYATGVSLTPPVNARYFKWTLYASSRTTIDIDFVRQCYIMLNTGSTALPYEPYGKYKVPVINNGVTKNIYLNQPIRKIGNYSDIINSDGTVTRKIEKFSLTGKESWQLWGANYFSTVIDKKGAINSIVCSHFVDDKQNGMSYDNLSSAGLEINALAVPFVANVTELKQWLADEYAAGHPVDVWYVSKTPTTESITTPTISTIEGTNTIEVDTTLPPSKIDITGHIKPVQ